MFVLGEKITLGSLWLTAMKEPEAEDMVKVIMKWYSDEEAGNGGSGTGVNPTSEKPKLW